MRGGEAIAQWFRTLNGMMEYDRFEPFEAVAQGDTVIVPHHPSRRARTTGRRFQSDIIRIYTMRNGKIGRVRNYYDAASYVAALREAIRP